MGHLRKIKVYRVTEVFELQLEPTTCGLPDFFEALHQVQKGRAKGKTPDFEFVAIHPDDEVTEQDLP